MSGKNNLTVDDSDEDNDVENDGSTVDDSGWMCNCVNGHSIDPLWVFTHTQLDTMAASLSNLSNHFIV